MNKEIKVIDLLKDYADGKEIPRKIKIGDEFYTRTGNSEIYYMYNNYYNETNHYWMDAWSIGVSCKTGIIDTVEIIEEDNNKIEKMKIDEVEDAEHLKFKEKINEIIDKINNL